MFRVACLGVGVQQEFFFASSRNMGAEYHRTSAKGEGYRKILLLRRPHRWQFSMVLVGQDVGSPFSSDNMAVSTKPKTQHDVARRDVRRHAIALSANALFPPLGVLIPGAWIYYLRTRKLKKKRGGDETVGIAQSRFGGRVQPPNCKGLISEMAKAMTTTCLPRHACRRGQTLGSSSGV